MGRGGFPYLRGYPKTKVLGKIYREQMYKTDEEKCIIPRLSSSCENCNNNEYYTIKLSSRACLFFIPLVKCDKVYKITCPNCGETIELEYDEFLVFRPLVKVNKALEEGRITKLQHERGVRDILDKMKCL